MVSTLSTVVSAIVMVYLARQVKDNRRFVKAQLLNAIEAEYGQRHYGTYNLLLPGAIWSPEGVGPNGYEDLHAIEAYLEFFEKISLILETGALDLDTVDRLFAHRFFLAMNNPHVEKLIHRDEPYWPALLGLHKKWSLYRKKRDMPTPNPDSRFMTSSERASILAAGDEISSSV